MMKQVRRGMGWWRGRIVVLSAMLVIFISLQPNTTVEATAFRTENPGPFLSWPLPSSIQRTNITRLPDSPWTHNFLGITDCPPYPSLIDDGYWPYFGAGNYPGNRDKIKSGVPDSQVVWENADNGNQFANAFACYGANSSLGLPDHAGTDFSASNGTNIFAAAPGVVHSQPYKGTDNNWIIVIRHDNVNNSGQTWYTKYVHVAAEYVSQGQTVSAGTVIGTVGSGHLHFETLYGGTHSGSNARNHWGIDQAPWTGCLWLDGNLCPIEDSLTLPILLVGHFQPPLTVRPSDVVQIVNRIGQSTNSSNEHADIDRDGIVGEPDANIIMPYIGENFFNNPAILYRAGCGAEGEVGWRAHEFQSTNRLNHECYGFDSTYASMYGWGEFETFPPLIGDFNGNGQDEVVYRGRFGSEGSECWRAHELGQDGQFRTSCYGDVWMYGWGETEKFNPLVGDFDGDSKDEIVYRAHCGAEGEFGWRAHELGQDNILNVRCYGDVWMYGWGNYETFTPLVGDFNDNGKDEIVYRARCGAEGEVGWRAHELQSDGKLNHMCYGFDSTYASMYGWGEFETFPPLVGDFNGNGQDEVVYRGRFGSDGTECWRAHELGDNGQFQTYCYGDVWMYGWGNHETFVPVVMDFNHNNKDEIIYRARCGAEGELSWRVHELDHTNKFTSTCYGDEWMYGWGNYEVFESDPIIP